MLRTVFEMEDGQPSQVLHPSPVFRLKVVNLASIGGDPDDAARRLATDEALQAGEDVLAEVSRTDAARATRHVRPHAAGSPPPRAPPLVQ